MRFAVSALKKYRILIAVVACNAVGATLLWTGMSRFDALMLSGSRIAQPQSGRVYQLHNHGDISYVTAETSMRGGQVCTNY